MTNNLSNEFAMQQQNPTGVMAQTSMSREMEEVKGQIFMAKQFPRNVFEAEKRIMDSCKRKSLAEGAIYSFPRGGTNVIGPSIRLAEVLAQNWGNISFGIKELEQHPGESVAMAYAWDVETNTRQEKIFTVPHKRVTRKGVQNLTDPRDIYELVANNGSRRLRACILGVIPGDIVEAAVNECNKTLQGENVSPLKERLARALNSFKDEFKVTQDMIEERFGYDIYQFSEKNFIELVAIFNALKDGISKANEVFEFPENKKAASNLEEEFKKNEDKKEVEKPKKEVTDDAAEQGELL